MKPAMREFHFIYIQYQSAVPEIHKVLRHEKSAHHGPLNPVPTSESYTVHSTIHFHKIYILIHFASFRSPHSAAPATKSASQRKALQSRGPGN